MDLGCLSNYRLASLDVYSGINMLVEYDKLIFDVLGNMVYGIEETRSRSCSSLLDKATQALSGSAILPWIPYRLSQDIVENAKPCPPKIKNSIYIMAPPRENEVKCEDARLLDAFFSEMAILAKLLALMPVQGNTYMQLVKIASLNTSALLTNTNSYWREIYDYLTSINEDIAKNLKTLERLATRLRSQDSNCKDIEKCIVEISESHEGKELFNKFRTECNGEAVLIILMPRLYVTYSIKNMINSLCEAVKDIKIRNILVIGYDKLNIVQSQIREKCSLNSKYLVMYKDQEFESIKNEIKTISSNNCVIISTLVDFPKDNYEKIITYLNSLLQNNQVKRLLLTLIQYRIGYTMRNGQANTKKDPAVIYYGLR